LRIHTIKGHFCSLLVSNIFCNPLFHQSTLCFLSTLPKTLLCSFLKREYLFVLDRTQNTKGEIFCSSQKIFSTLFLRVGLKKHTLDFPTMFFIYLNAFHTAVFFHLTLLFSLRSTASNRSVKSLLRIFFFLSPLARTSFAFIV